MARIEYPGSSGSNKLGALAGNYVSSPLCGNYVVKTLRISILALYVVVVKGGYK